MGQKVNPNIFRLGVSKKWDTKFIEKKTCELPLYILKDLELQRYIKQLFKNSGFLVYNLKQEYNKDLLNVNISYIISPDFSGIESRKSFDLVNLVKDEAVFNLDRAAVKERALLKKRPVQKEKFSKYFNKRKLVYKVRRFNLSNNYLILKNPRERMLLRSISHLLKVIRLYLPKIKTVSISFNCVNKDLYYLKNHLKQSILKLQRFKKSFFFREGVELFFYSVLSESSSNVIANFIGSQIKVVKNQNFLLKFLKHTLKTLVNFKFSIVQGIKISLKGKLNGRPRAKKKTLIIGKVPVQSFATSVDYSEKFIHNAQGTYGIKVWVVYK